MTFTPEQMIAAHKANVETLFGLTAKAFEGVEKLVELNLQVARASLSEAAETAQAAMRGLEGGLRQALAPRLDRLTEMLEEALSVGDHALIFTQFVEMGQLIQEHLRQRAASHVN